MPTYSFGESSLFTQMSNPRGSWVRGFQEAVLRAMGVAPAIFIGRGIFQYNFGIVPHRKPINTVCESFFPSLNSFIKFLSTKYYSMTFSNAARNSIFTNLQLLFLEFSLMKLAISNILVVYYVETMIFLGKLSYPCVTKCCKMESS